MKLKWIFLCLMMLAGIPIPSLANESRDELSDRKVELNSLSEDAVIDYYVSSFSDLFPLSDDVQRKRVKLYFEKVNWLSLEIFQIPFHQLTFEEIEQLMEEPRMISLSSILLSDFFQDPIIDGCLYQGTTAYDRPMTEAVGYKFQGHIAIYFRVDGNANCYSKWCSTDTWGSDCGNGKIPHWSLLCKAPGCEWYWWNGKYVKDVVMLVPHSWWYAPQFWFVPASTKASWFLLSWRSNQVQGCCDPGCR